MKVCKNCNKDIPSRNTFCNNHCQNDYTTKVRIKEWFDGKNFVRKGGTQIPSWMRKFLLSESQNSCSICGWSKKNEFTNTYPLDIDHIDGDAHNNLRENLRVVCPNCHSLTKTYKNSGSRKSSRNNRNKPA
jgi:RNA polymerase subunit RPABC4/transcription elongation factor Spt4